MYQQTLSGSGVNVMYNPQMAGLDLSAAERQIQFHQARPRTLNLEP